MKQEHKLPQGWRWTGDHGIEHSCGAVLMYEHGELTVFGSAYPDMYKYSLEIIGMVMVGRWQHPDIMCPNCRRHLDADWCWNCKRLIT